MSDFICLANWIKLPVAKLVKYFVALFVNMFAT